eukprot:scaffold2062_cov273-Chaetoceros_neogracile.AAC.2
MIEYVGSGLGHGHDSENSVSDDEYYSDVSLARQAEEFEHIVKEFSSLNRLILLVSLLELV